MVYHHIDALLTREFSVLFHKGSTPENEFMSLGSRDYCSLSYIPDSF